MDMKIFRMAIACASIMGAGLQAMNASCERSITLGEVLEVKNIFDQEEPFSSSQRQKLIDFMNEGFVRVCDCLRSIADERVAQSVDEMKRSIEEFLNQNSLDKLLFAKAGRTCRFYIQSVLTTLEANKNQLFHKTNPDALKISEQIKHHENKIKDLQNALQESEEKTPIA